MTLFRQLILSGLVILLFIFVGMTTYVVKNTQTFIDQQLSSHAQDTATALGLCLTLTMKSNDVVTASRIVDAIWDRGYYKSVEVQATNGVVIVERHMDIKVHNVPDWFIEMVELTTEKREALIMDGWQKVGKVIIQSNPGYGYQQIWTTFIDCLQWLLITGLFAAVLGWMMLMVILRPLRAITAQAIAICNQQFQVQEKLPWTVDLRKVVEAMNKMSRKLQALFEEQSKVSEQLRQQVYQDPLTGLSNRRYFDLHFDHLLKDIEHGLGGILMLVELKDFKSYNEIFGFEGGDTLLKNVAKVILDSCSKQEYAIVTHAKGAGFFIILPGKAKVVGETVGAKISDQFKVLIDKGQSQRAEIGNIGITEYKVGEEKKDIMSRVDMALRAAQSKAENSWHFFEGMKGTVVQGAMEWKAIFEKVLRENKVVLHFQETRLFTSKSIKLVETLMRIKIKEDEIISAGVFIPMAEQLNQTLALDKLVIENIVRAITSQRHDFIFSVNLSPQFLDDETFKKWLLDQAKSLGKRAGQLMIELPEHGVTNRIEKARNFFLKFAELGGKTAIDHYGKSFNSFSYLYNLRLNYLKIDGGFVRNIEQSQENQFFVRSLVDIAHSLDILVIAEAVETEEEYEMLVSLKVDGAQGYYVGKPTYIEI